MVDVTDIHLFVWVKSRTLTRDFSKNKINYEAEAVRNIKSLVPSRVICGRQPPSHVYLFAVTDLTCPIYGQESESCDLCP